MNKLSKKLVSEHKQRILKLIGIPFDTAKTASADHVETRLADNWPLQGWFQDTTKKTAFSWTCAVTINERNYLFSGNLRLVTGGAVLEGDAKGLAKIAHLILGNLQLTVNFGHQGFSSLGIATRLSTTAFSSELTLLFDPEDPELMILVGSLYGLTLYDVATLLAKARYLPEEIGMVLEKISLEKTHTFRLPASISKALDNLEFEQVAAAFNRSGKMTLSSHPHQILMTTQTAGQRWFLTELKAPIRHYCLEKIDNKIHVTQHPQLYYVPQGAQIGTLDCPARFVLSGVMNLFGLKANTQVHITPQKGIAVEAVMDKALVINNAFFFRLRAADGKNTGPTLRLNSFPQRSHPDKAFRPPHVYLDGQLNLLGLKATGLVNVKAQGLFFYLKDQINVSVSGRGLSQGEAILDYDIDGHTATTSTLSAYGELTVTLSGILNLAKLDGLAEILADSAPAEQFPALGKIKLDIQASGTIKAKFGSGQAYARFHGSFKFADQWVRFNCQLDVNTPSLSKIGDQVLAEVKKRLLKHLGNAVNWMDWVDKNQILGIQDNRQIACVISILYGCPVHETSRLLQRKGNRDAEKIGDALVKGANTSAEETAKALSLMQTDARKTARFLKKYFRLPVDDTRRLLGEYFKLSGDRLENALLGGGYTSKSVSNASSDKSMLDAAGS